MKVNRNKIKMHNRHLRKCHDEMSAILYDEYTLISKTTKPSKIKYISLYEKDILTATVYVL